MNRVSTSRLHEVDIANMGQHMIYDGGSEPLENMRDSLYFLPAAHRLRVGDLIEVFWREEGWLSRYARLRVLRILPEDGVHTALEGAVSYDREGGAHPVGPDAPPADEPAPPAPSAVGGDERNEDDARCFVQGDAERKWNVGIQKHEVRQGDTVICAVDSKELAEAIAAGKEPIPAAAPAPEAA